MDQFEMVNKLREKANVSAADAKAALEATEWDLLDALVLLDGERKQVKNEQPAPTQPVNEKNLFKGSFDQIFDTIIKLIEKANATSFEVRKGERIVLSLPLLAFIPISILLIIFMFWFILPLSILGWIFNFKYSFRRKNIKASINHKINKASSIAEDIKSKVREEKDEEADK